MGDRAVDRQRASQALFARRALPRSGVLARPLDAPSVAWTVDRGVLPGRPGGPVSPRARTGASIPGTADPLRATIRLAPACARIPDAEGAGAIRDADRAVRVRPSRIRPGAMAAARRPAEPDSGSYRHRSRDGRIRSSAR